MSATYSDTSGTVHSSGLHIADLSALDGSANDSGLVVLRGAYKPRNGHELRADQPVTVRFRPRAKRSTVLEIDATVEYVRDGAISVRGTNARPAPKSATTKRVNMTKKSAPASEANEPTTSAAETDNDATTATVDAETSRQIVEAILARTKDPWHEDVESIEDLPILTLDQVIGTQGRPRTKWTVIRTGRDEDGNFITTRAQLQTLSLAADEEIQDQVIVEIDEKGNEVVKPDAKRRKLLYVYHTLAQPKIPLERLEDMAVNERDLFYELHSKCLSWNGEASPMNEGQKLILLRLYKEGKVGEIDALAMFRSSRYFE